MKSIKDKNSGSSYDVLIKHLDTSKNEALYIFERQNENDKTEKLSTG